MTNATELPRFPSNTFKIKDFGNFIVNSETFIHVAVIHRLLDLIRSEVRRPLIEI